jgi:hypothetical protein
LQNHPDPLLTRRRVHSFDVDCHLSI